VSKRRGSREAGGFGRAARPVRVKTVYGEEQALPDECNILTNEVFWQSDLLGAARRKNKAQYLREMTNTRANPTNEPDAWQTREWMGPVKPRPR
jgi:hypothetical protein